MLGELEVGMVSRFKDGRNKKGLLDLVIRRLVVIFKRLVFMVKLEGSGLRREWE